jgi:phospholipid transport system transporter-binding protein
VSKKNPPRAAKSKRAARPAHVELDVRMTIAQAADLHRMLLARLAQGEAIIIDGTQVEEIDTAILQLLTCLWRTGRERGIACTWHGASDVLRQSAGLIGVADMLQLPGGGPARDGGRGAG